MTKGFYQCPLNTLSRRSVMKQQILIISSSVCQGIFWAAACFSTGLPDYIRTISPYLSLNFANWQSNFAKWGKIKKGPPKKKNFLHQTILNGKNQHKWTIFLSLSLFWTQLQDYNCKSPQTSEMNTRCSLTKRFYKLKCKTLSCKVMERYSMNCIFTLCGTYFTIF